MTSQCHFSISVFEEMEFDFLLVHRLGLGIRPSIKTKKWDIKILVYNPIVVHN